MKSLRIMLITCFILALGSYALVANSAGHANEQACQWMSSQIEMPSWMDAPMINPRGSELIVRDLGNGAYALISNKPPVNNSGFIVGERGVLVIDSHINAEMARKIQDAVREVTDKPILYLVNTNYHGDHSFGNYAFPQETTIIAHQQTALKMLDFEDEKRFLFKPVNCDSRILADVQLRLPSMQFEKSLKIDLGNREIEIHHFGPGNTPGDTVVFDSTTKTAWTGNLILGAPSVPWMLTGEPQQYIESLARFSALDIEFIIPGHGAETGREQIQIYSDYLKKLISDVKDEALNGRTLEETVSNLPLDKMFLPQGTPKNFAELLMDMHRWNVTKTYEETNEY